MREEDDTREPMTTAEPLLPATADPPPQRKPKAAAERLLSLDLMRGAIMVVMAWDHSVDILSDGKLPRDNGFQAWSGHLATYDESGVCALCGAGGLSQLRTSRVARRA